MMTAFCHPKEDSPHPFSHPFQPWFLPPSICALFKDP
jgi:hypothetical protein